MNRLQSNLALIIFVLFSRISAAQEDLTTILERGFPTQWLVCGPFGSDLDDGIINAIASAQLPLGRKDFMASRGGIKNIRPANGLAIAKPGGEAVWLSIRADESTVDLSPFFEDADSGIAFAAFYAKTLSEQSVLIDLQSALGARVFLNGVEIKEASAAPLSLAGVDHFEAKFVPGTNLMILEVPGAKIDALAEKLKQSRDTFLYNQFQNQSDLVVKTGFEFRLTVKQLKSFDDIQYVPDLQSTGTFSGQGDNLFQDVWLTLFNPGDTPSPELAYSASVSTATARINLTIPAISPNAIHRERIQIPISKQTPGQAVRVTSMLSDKPRSEQWTSNVVVTAKPALAQFHVVDTPSISNVPSSSEAAMVNQYQADLASKILRNRENPEFGFSLGSADLWLPVLAAHPELRHPLAPMLKNQSVAPWSTYSQIDERVASGEAIIRNLWFGNALADLWLGTTQKTYWAWNSPAIAPQTAQILKDAGVPGIIHNLPYDGLPSLYFSIAPDGSRMLHRRKANTPAPKSILNLHQSAKRQHQFWESSGMQNDLLVRENIAHAAEPFWMTDTLPLSEAYPPLMVNGGGADLYFDALAQERPFQMAAHLWQSMGTTHDNPFSLLHHPELSRLYADSQQQLHAAETFATFDAVETGHYPFATINDAWKKMLHLSHPLRTSDNQSIENYIDQLDIYRHLEAITAPVLDQSLENITARINTDTENAPDVQGALAIVVFNPTSQPRSDLVKATLNLDNAQGLTLLDAEGKSVPFEASNLRIENRRLVQADVQFLARSVPSIGYTTYYAVPSGGLAQLRELFTPYIENEFFQIHLSGGEISKIIDRSGRLPELSDLKFNDIVAYHLNPDGEEIIWNTEITRASQQESETTYEATPLGQRVTIKTPFAGGQLVRTITLHKNIPWIDIRVETINITLDNIALGAEFTPIPEGLAPVQGHQYASTFGRPILHAASIQGSDGDSTIRFDANTSLGFQGLAVPPHIKIENQEIYIPFEPAMIIHTGANPHDRAVKKLQQSLIVKGLPTSAYAHDALNNRSIWPDDTLFREFNDDLAQGTYFRFLVGRPDENHYTENLLSQMSGAAQLQVNELIEESLPIFTYDKNVPFGHEPLPTLIIAGRNINATESLIEKIAQEMHDEGSITLTQNQYLPANIRKKPTWAAAIFHPGAAVSRVENDIWTHFFQTKKDSGNTEIAPTSHIFHYALRPYSGTLSSSDLPQLAQRYTTPLLAAQTGIHSGPQASTHSYLSTTTANFLVTNIHPKIPSATLLSNKSTLIEAILVRGYESRGHNAEVSLQFSPSIYGIAKLNPLEQVSGNIDTVTGEPKFKIHANGIRTIALYTTPSGKRKKEGGDAAQSSPIQTQSWNRNSGPAPGADQALTVRINTPIPTPAGTVHVTVANNSPDRFYSGQLTVVVAQGWAVSPAAQPYNLAPHSFATYDLTVSRENEELMQWGMLAQIDHGDSTTFDVATNFEYPVEVSTDSLKNEYRITIRNRGGLPLIGSAQLFTNFDTSNGGSPLTPIEKSFHIQPYQDKRIVYKNNGPEPPKWIYAKVTANNQALYHAFEFPDQE